jgi:phospholipid/cholesterol/gamma-HCH transport system substrate-binding protein
MTGKPFKFRYVNELAGGMVLLTVALLAAGLVLVVRSQRWFEDTLIVRTVLPRDGSAGLKRGAEVQIFETPVGLVREIEVSDDGRMEAELTVREDFARFVRADSEVIIKKRYQVAGDAYCEITFGDGPPAEDGAVLPSRRDTELTEMARDIVEQVRAEIVPALETLRDAVEEYRLVAKGLNDPDGALQQFLAHLNNIATELEEGEGTAGRLLRDEYVADQVEGILEEINRSLEHLSGIMNDVRQASHLLPEIASTAGSELKDVSGLTLETRNTLRETREMIEGLKRHWLLRKYMEEDPLGEKLPLDAADRPPTAIGPATPAPEAPDSGREAP